MSLGNTYNNNDSKKNYSPSVAGYKLTNADSKVDPTAMSFNFWNKMLKISIAPKKQSDPNTIAFDWDNAGTIYLTHSRARVLYNEICKFEENPSLKNVGVSSGAEGYISISNGEEVGSTSKCVIIRKINKENGSCESVYVYEFKEDFYTSIRNYNPENLEFDAEKYPDLELQQFKTVLEQYYLASTNAIAATVLDCNKYDTSRTQTKLDSIATKLGIEYGKNSTGGYAQKSSNSFFNKKSEDSGNFASGGSYTSSTIEDITNGL